MLPREKKIAKETAVRKESKTCTRKAEHMQRDSQESSKRVTAWEVQIIYMGAVFLVFVFL